MSRRTRIALVGAVAALAVPAVAEGKATVTSIRADNVALTVNAVHQGKAQAHTLTCAQIRYRYELLGIFGESSLFNPSNSTPVLKGRTSFTIDLAVPSTPEGQRVQVDYFDCYLDDVALGSFRWPPA
jgi:hypothetical protein